MGNPLVGDRAMTSLYSFRFSMNEDNKKICSKTFNADDINSFVSAVKEQYTFDIFVDDLFVDGYLGSVHSTEDESVPDQYLLYTHLIFHVRYNGPDIISVRIETDASKSIVLPESGDELPVEFSYSVDWTPIEVPFSKREVYHNRELIRQQPLEIHWLSIINSVVLMTAALSHCITHDILSHNINAYITCRLCQI